MKSDAERLEESEAALARLQRIGRICMFEVDIAHGLSGRRSPDYVRLHGLPDDTGSETHAQWLARVHAADRDYADGVLRAALAGMGATYEGEYRIIRPIDQEIRWISARGEIERDGHGRPLRLVGAHIDITRTKQLEHRLKEAERHHEMLLAELQHRVRNTIAVIRSIARRTAENSIDLEDMAAHLDGRFDAFARVQAMVTRSPHGHVDLATLIEDELLAHAARRGDRLTIAGPDVSLLPRPAETFSLAFHELTANAVKFGALAGEDGRLDISWTVEKGYLNLVWQENDVRVAADTGRDGFGFELLKRALPFELSATCDVQVEPTGLAFRLTMPLEGRALLRPQLPTG